MFRRSFLKAAMGVVSLPVMPHLLGAALGGALRFMRPRESWVELEYGWFTTYGGRTILVGPFVMGGDCCDVVISRAGKEVLEWPPKWTKVDDR